MKKIDIDGLYIFLTLTIAGISSVLHYLFLKDMGIWFSVTFFIFFAAASVFIFYFKKENMKLLVSSLLSIIPAVVCILFVNVDSVFEAFRRTFSLSVFGFITVQCFYKIIRDLKESGFKIKKISLGDPQKKLTRREILKIAKENLIVMLKIFILQITVTAFLGFLYARYRWNQYVGEFISSWSLDISFFAYFLCCCFVELPFGMLSVLIVTFRALVKKLCDGCIIFLCICFGFACLVFFTFRIAEIPCGWNPLIDTYHSSTFNINNVPKVKEGMTREEVDALIGEPIEQNGNYNRYTRDGACLSGDFAWYKIIIKFENDIVVSIESDVICD